MILDKDKNILIDYNFPILYSFRRCPYAMRARLSLYYQKIPFELREVELNNKPEELLKASPKGTVPVLVLKDKVIDESLDIMLWSMTQNDSNSFWSDLSTIERNYSLSMIDELDKRFKPLLDQYKYSSSIATKENFHNCLVLLNKWDTIIKNCGYFLKKYPTLVDIAYFPFIRQFYKVNESLWLSTDLSYLKKWLNNFLENKIFLKVMQKHSPWEKNQKPNLITFNS